MLKEVDTIKVKLTLDDMEAVCARAEARAERMEKRGHQVDNVETLEKNAIAEVAVAKHYGYNVSRNVAGIRTRGGKRVLIRANFSKFDDLVEKERSYEKQPDYFLLVTGQMPDNGGETTVFLQGMMSYEELYRYSTIDRGFGLARFVSPSDLSVDLMNEVLANER